MENRIHKGAELNNVRETWDENEKNLQNRKSPGEEGNASEEFIAESELDKLVKQEASEYDEVNKENRILSGDRATVNDDMIDNAGDE